MKQICPFQTMLGTRGSIETSCQTTDCALWMNYEGYQGCAISVMAMATVNNALKENMCEYPSDIWDFAGEDG